MAIDWAGAREAARQAVAAIGEREGFTAVLNDAETLESAFGWLFYYESPEFLQTGEAKSKLIGNAPLVVERESGRVFETGTEWPLALYLRPFLAAQELRPATGS